MSVNRMKDGRAFCSKILLFGEYSIIKNSRALAMPYPLFEGRLAFKGEGARIDPELKSFVSHAKQMLVNYSDRFDFDVTSFEFDVGQGLYFDSTIPQGYGVGSSGALCAALFDRYVKKSIGVDESIGELKAFFSKMESHFHGTSSGIDPLISYLGESLLIKGPGEVGPVRLPQLTEGAGALFLLNTGRPRRTEPLVNLFLEKCKNSQFDSLCSQVLVPITHRCIDSFLAGDMGILWESFKALSAFQYEHFSPMIPKLFGQSWQEGLSSGAFALKLCGAGGGGLILGMAPDLKKALPYFAHHEIRPFLRTTLKH